MAQEEEVTAYIASSVRKWGGHWFTFPSPFYIQPGHPTHRMAPFMFTVHLHFPVMLWRRCPRNDQQCGSWVTLNPVAPGKISYHIDRWENIDK